MHISTLKNALVLLVWSALCVSEPLFDMEKLPAGEREAGQFLAEGVLDSSLWEQIRPYYAQPLSVPAGELRFLRNIIPGLSSKLPTTASALKKYEPWDSKKKKQFFNDYPELVPFEPVLSFSFVNMPHRGVAGFKVYKRGGPDEPLIGADFSVSPAPFFSAGGRLKSDAGTVRWQRRSIVGRIGEKAAISLGNYVGKINNGLCYGYFSSIQFDRLEPQKNWLYAESRTWNGGMLELNISDNTEFSTFFHAGTDETIAGVLTAFTPAGGIDAYAGASGLKIYKEGNGGADTLIYLHAGAVMSAGVWSVELNTGAGAGKHPAFPLAIILENTQTNSSGSISFCRVPGSFDAPLSQIKRRAMRKLEYEDFNASEDVYECRMDFHHEINTFFDYSPSFIYTASPVRSSMDGIVTLAGKKPLSYRLRYRFHPALGTTEEFHRFSIRSEYTLHDRAAAKVRMYTMVRPARYTTRSACLSFEWNAMQTIMLEPFFSYYGNTKGDNNYFAGIIQEIELFEKTDGVLEIEVPFDGSGEVHINARADFFF
ncbi:MAG: hypothetical protein GF350_13765 [Chitinivibrionales bacterium]|nr:hypothetical protein [Chitinivibrionales bacterium]